MHPQFSDVNYLSHITVSEGQLISRILFILLVSPTFLLATPTDWTSINPTTDTAAGNLGPISILLSGGDLDNGGLTDNTYTGFNQSFFSPQLPTSDVISLRGLASTAHYTMTFSAPLTDPYIHLASFASSMTFPGHTLTKVSGESTFLVSGDHVTGITNDNPTGHDSNGTVLVNGTFSSLTFDATYPTIDGIYFQLGATIPEPTSVLLLTPALLLLRRRKPPSAS